MAKYSKASKIDPTLTDAGLNLGSDKKVPDLSNSLNSRFVPCPIFISYDDTTNIHGLYMSWARNAAKKL